MIGVRGTFALGLEGFYPEESERLVAFDERVIHRLIAKLNRDEEWAPAV